MDHFENLHFLITVNYAFNVIDNYQNMIII